MCLNAVFEKRGQAGVTKEPIVAWKTWITKKTLKKSETSATAACSGFDMKCK